MSTMIEGTKSNDTLTNEEDRVTLNASVGNDLIINSGAEVLMIGGFGNDVLENSGDFVSLDGGLGSDRLELNGNNQTILYADGDGNDAVYGYEESDTLYLTDGSNYTLSTNGDDAFVKVGLGTITFKNAADKTINIIRAANDDDTSDNPNDDTSEEPAIKNGATQLGGDGADIFVYEAGSGAGVIGNAKDESTRYQARDAVVILGEIYDDLTDVLIKDNKDVVTVKFDGDKRSKLTVNKDAATTPITFYFGADSDTAIERGGVIYGDLPDGVHYAEEGKAYTRLIVDDTIEGEIIEATVINSQLKEIDASNAEGYVEIYGNDNKNVLKGGAGGSLLNGGSGNDQLYGTTDASAIDTFVFEMQPGGKKDVVFNYNVGDMIVIDATLLEENAPIFDAGEGVITYDGTKSDFNGFDDSKDDVVLTLNKKNTLTLKNASGKAIDIYDEKFNHIGTFGHFLPDGLTYSDNQTAIEVSDAEELIGNGFVEIDLTNASESEYTFASTVKKVDLRAVEDAEFASTIVGNALANEMHGSGGFDTFVYAAGGGKDIIAEFGENDVMSIDGALDDIAISDKKNVVSVTLNGDKNDVITIEKRDINTPITFRAADEEFVYGVSEGMSLNHNGTTLAIDGEEDDYIIAIADSINSQIKTIDARDSAAYVEIRGNDSHNALYAGDGGSSLDGGAGADKLYGGAGADVFVYNFAGGTGGKDVIKDFDAESDIIELDIAPKSVKSNGRNLVLNFEQMIDGKKKKSTLTINGTEKITSETAVGIMIDGEFGEYWFERGNNVWNDSASEGDAQLNEIIAIEGAVDMPTDFMTEFGNVSMNISSRQSTSWKKSRPRRLSA